MGIGFNISGEYLDLYPNTDVIFDYAPNSFSEITTRQGITSADFDLPRTARNERLLKEDTIRAILESEGGSQFEGFIRVHKRFSFVDQKITCFFTASNTEWGGLIKGKSIREIDLERYNHVYDANTIVNSFDNKEGFIYPLIDYGNAELKTSFEFTVIELAPAIYASTILKQIFQDLGIIVEGTLLNNVLFKKIALPFSGKNIPIFNRDINASLFTGFTPTMNGTFDLELTNVLFGDELVVDLDNNRIVNIADFDILVNITATEIFGVTGFDYIVKAISSDANETIIFDSTVSLSQATEGINVPANGFIRFNITISNYFLNQDTSIYLQITDQLNAVNNTLIDVSNSLSDISQEDFLAYIFFTFGVLAQYNVSSKTITLNQYNDLESNKSKAINISSLVDLSQSVEENFDEVSQGYAQINELEYQGDSNDDKLEEFEDLNGKALGFGALGIDNLQLEEVGNLYTSPFSGTFNRDTFLETSGFTTSPYLPYLPRLNVDTGILETDLEPRVLVIETGFNYGQPVSVGAESSMTAPFARFVKSITSSSDYNDITASLAFSNFGVVAPNDTPIIESELSLIRQMLSEGKGLSIYVAYELDQIQNIDFSIPVYLELEELTGYYFISGIEGIDGKSHSYKFDLIKI